MSFGYLHTALTGTLLFMTLGLVDPIFDLVILFLFFFFVHPCPWQGAAGAQWILVLVVEGSNNTHASQDRFRSCILQCCNYA